MIPQVQIQLGQAFPVALVLRLDGSLVFVKLTPRPFAVIDDSSTFDQNGFTIDGEDFAYNMAYYFRREPKLTKWIKDQQIINPFTTGNA
jgi:hypothetical protein